MEAAAALEPQAPASTKSEGTHLPLTRVKTIMKSSPDIEKIANDAIMAMARATEMFVKYLTANAYIEKKNAKTGSLCDLDYNHLSDLVVREEKLEFLSHIIPKKLTVKEVIALQNEESSSSDDEEEEEEASEEEESESEEDEETEKSKTAKNNSSSGKLNVTADETIELSD